MCEFESRKHKSFMLDPSADDDKKAEIDKVSKNESDLDVHC